MFLSNTVKLLLLLFISSATLCSIAWSRDSLTYKIGDIEVFNIHESYQEVIKELLRYELERRQAFSADSPQSLVVSLKLISTNKHTKILVNVLEGSTTIWIDSLSISTPDELDKAIDRIASSVVFREALSENQDIHNVTRKEELPLNKQITTNYLGIQLGYAGLESSDYSFKTMSKIGIFYLIDFRNVFGEIYWSKAKNSQSLLSNIGINILYPFSDRSSTVYAGGGISIINFQNFNNNSAPDIYTDGTGFKASLGYLFGRTSDAVIRVEGCVFSNTLDEGSNQLGFDITLSLGM
ncbi:MAG: hypothetical protein ACOH5I_22245 [Oligoflexus sp.]